MDVATILHNFWSAYPQTLAEGLTFWDWYAIEHTYLYVAIIDGPEGAFARLVPGQIIFGPLGPPEHLVPPSDVN